MSTLCQPKEHKRINAFVSRTVSHGGESGPACPLRGSGRPAGTTGDRWRGQLWWRRKWGQGDMASARCCGWRASGAVPVCEHTHLPRVQAAASDLCLVQKPPPADGPHDLPSWHDREQRAPPEGFLPETEPGSHRTRVAATSQLQEAQQRAHRGPISQAQNGETSSGRITEFLPQEHCWRGRTEGHVAHVWACSCTAMLVFPMT